MPATDGSFPLHGPVLVGLRDASVLSRCERFGLVFAHIAGIPLEEALLSFAPMLAATGGVAGGSWFRRPRDRPGRHSHQLRGVQSCIYGIRGL
jgi:hypothetical protein